MINVAIIGAAGRMGQALVRCSHLMNNVKLVAAVEQAASPFCGKDAGIAACCGDTGVKITHDLATAAQAASDKQKEAEAMMAKATAQVKAASDAAAPKDIVDIYVSAPIRVSVKPKAAPAPAPAASATTAQK